MDCHLCTWCNETGVFLQLLTSQFNSTCSLAFEARLTVGLLFAVVIFQLLSLIGCSIALSYCSCQNKQLKKQGIASNSTCALLDENNITENISIVGDSSDRSQVVAMSNVQDPPVCGELKEEYEELEVALAGIQHKTVINPAKKTLPVPPKQGFSPSDDSAEYVEAHSTTALYENLNIHSQVQRQTDQSRNRKVDQSRKKPVVNQIQEEESYEVIQHEQPRSIKNKRSTLPTPPRATNQQARMTRTLPYRGPVVEEESYVDIRPRP